MGSVSVPDRVTNPPAPLRRTVSVKIAGASAANGGAVGFRSGTTGAFASTLTLTRPDERHRVPFFTAGKFGQPSTNNGDVKIEARVGNTMVGSAKVMVRIRKNANTLTPGERDRFVAAFAKLNNQGLGRYVGLPQHAQRCEPAAGARRAGLPAVASRLSARSRARASGDRPERRAALLALRPGLPRISSSPSSSGVSDANSAPSRSRNSNPLQFWKTDGQPGINRRPLFNTAGAPPNPITEAQTLGARHQFPHVPDHGGQSARIGAHQLWRLHLRARRPPRRIRCSSCSTATSIGCGQSGSARTAASIRRVVASFDNKTASPAGPQTARHHVALERHHRWHRRPPDGAGRSAGPVAAASGRRDCSRVVQDMLDYHGVISAASNMGFDYDDVQL